MRQPIILEPGGPIDQQLSSLQSRSHVGHHELYALESRQRFTELLPFLDVIDGILKCAFTYAQALSGYGNAPAGQKTHS